MKKFRFRLQSVLDHKKRKEDSKKEELGKLLHTVQEVRDFMATLKSRCSLSIVEMRNLQENGISVDLLSQYRSFVVSLKNDITGQMDKLSDLMKEVDARRKELVAMSKERKVMEKLKDKEFERFKRAVLREEKKLIDEIGASRFIKRHLAKIDRTR